MEISSRLALRPVQPPPLGTGLFPGVKQLGLGIDHPPLPNAKSIPLFPLCAFAACYWENFTLRCRDILKFSFICVY
jgi:hypothetical protein